MNTESVKLGDYDHKRARNHKGDSVKKANEFLQSVNRVLYDLLNQNCKPQGVELRHVVAKD